MENERHCFRARKPAFLSLMCCCLTQSTHNRNEHETNAAEAQKGVSAALAAAVGREFPASFWVRMAVESAPPGAVP